MKHSLLALAIAILMLAGCGSQSENTQTEGVTGKTSKVSYEGSQVATGKSQTMLFFLNPNGRPCMVQDRILNGMAEQLKAKNVKIRYVSTHKMNTDGPTFRRYGIRALPSIIVLDENGDEKKRLPPGVHGPDTLLDVVN